MDKQQTFVGLTGTQKRKLTRRERFVVEMDRVVSWAQLKALIAPQYHPARGRRPDRRRLHTSGLGQKRSDVARL